MKKDKIKKLIFLQKINFFGLLFAAAIVFIGCYNQPAADQDILEVNLKEHKNLALHIHPNLEIKILDQQFSVPANVGISANGMKVIHTHDATGKLHIESPYPHQFYLKDFFTIWKKNLNSSCIFEYCEDESHKLEFYVDGVKNEQREYIPLKDGESILISYGKK